MQIKQLAKMLAAALAFVPLLGAVLGEARASRLSPNPRWRPFEAATRSLANVP